MLTAVAQRWRERRGTYVPAADRIDPSKYEVHEVGRDEAKAFVVAHHYSGDFPAERRSYGLFRGSALQGVAVLSHPVRNEVLTNVFDVASATEAAELGRLVLLDEVPGIRPPC